MYVCNIPFSTAPDSSVTLPAPDDRSFNTSQAIFGATYTLPVFGTPSQSFIVRWWFNGRMVDLSTGSKYSIDSTAFTLSVSNIEYPEGGIYQAEVTVLGSNVSDFRNHVVSGEYFMSVLQ